MQEHLVIRLNNKYEKKYHIKIRPIFILVIVLTSCMSLNIKTSSEELRPEEGFAGTKKFIVLLIDGQSLFCPLCLEIFRKFCDLLRSSGLDEHAMGVLVYQVSDDNEDRPGFERVIEGRLRGLIISSNIRFPFFYDEFHIFEGMELEGATVILFDRSRKLLKKYALPLTREQIEEVLSF
ncbi:MAG: hypothetical protein GTO17_10735 [Candidatus Aminicenantes bacterium]|nr:hypothetical protein [Candidatus Aminicenantes bacterium]